VNVFGGVNAQELRQSVEETRARKMAAFAERETLLSGQINLARKVRM
jgi:hypothetical protein